MSLKAPFSFFVLGYLLCCCFLLLLFTGMFYTEQDWGCQKYETVQRESLISRLFLHAWNWGQTLWSISKLPPTSARALPWGLAECDCRAESCLPRSPEEERLLLSGWLCVQGMCSLTPAAYAEAQEASWYYFSCFSAQISLKLEFGNKNILKAYLQTKIWIPWRVKYILSVTVCHTRRCWHGTR